MAITNHQPDDWYFFYRPTFQIGQKNNDSSVFWCRSGVVRYYLSIYKNPESQLWENSIPKSLTIIFTMLPWHHKQCLALTNMSLNLQPLKAKTCSGDVHIFLQIAAPWISVQNWIWPLITNILCWNTQWYSELVNRCHGKLHIILIFVSYYT